MSPQLMDFRFQDVKLRASEKSVRSYKVMCYDEVLLIRLQIFNKLRKDIDIRYEIKKVEKTSDKVFLIIQVSHLHFSIRHQILNAFF